MLYVDGADRSAVEALLATGTFHGVTTNPLILERAGLTDRDLPDLYRWAVAAGAQEVFMQGWVADVETLRRRCDAILAIGERVIIKVPATPHGITAAADLVRDGARVLLTAVHDERQVLVADAIGAHWIAPYVGRMTSAGLDGVGAVLRMQRVLDRSGGATRIIAASIRSLADAVTLAEGGVADLTLGAALADELLSHPLTVAADADFERAAAPTDVTGE
jgi:transaldolase